MCQVSSSYSLLLPSHCLHVLHVIMSISFAYVFVSCIRAFSPLSVLHSGAPISSDVPFYLFSCADVKHFWIGPRRVMRPWFTTDRPPAKFHRIRSSFDAPTDNYSDIIVGQIVGRFRSPETLPGCISVPLFSAYLSSIAHLAPPPPTPTGAIGS